MNKLFINIETIGQLVVFIILIIALFFVLTVFHMWIFKVAVMPFLPFAMEMPSFWQFVGWEILANVFFKNADSSWFRIKTIGGEVNGESQDIK